MRLLTLENPSSPERKVLSRRRHGRSQVETKIAIGAGRKLAKSAGILDVVRWMADHAAMTIQITAIEEADLAPIAELQIRSWQTAYSGLMDDAFLDQTVPRALRDHWATMPGEGWLLLAAREQTALVGFVAIKLGRGEKLAYVDNLHVEPRLKGRGIGRLLMREAAQRMLDLDETGVWLTVLHNNAPSREFYRRIGGEEGALKHEFLVDQPVRSIPVYWHDLIALSTVR